MTGRLWALHPDKRRKPSALPQEETLPRCHRGAFANSGGLSDDRALFRARRTCGSAHRFARSLRHRGSASVPAAAAPAASAPGFVGSWVGSWNGLDPQLGVVTGSWQSIAIGRSSSITADVTLTGDVDCTVGLARGSGDQNLGKRDARSLALPVEFLGSLVAERRRLCNEWHLDTGQQREGSLQWGSHRDVRWTADRLRLAASRAARHDRHRGR